MKENFGNLPLSAIDIPMMAKCLLAAKGDRFQAKSIAQTRKASDRVMRLLDTKTAVPAGYTSDSNFGSVLGADSRIAARAFFESMRTTSVFFRLLNGGSFRPVPMRTRVGVVATGATGYVRGEGQAIPVSKLALALPEIAPQFAAAIVVVTDEVARSESSEASALVTTELRKAVGAAVDAEMFDRIIDSSTPSAASVGTDAAAMRTDIRFLLDAVNLSANGSLFWVMNVDVANMATLVDDPRAQMTPQGGELFGLPALVCDQVPAGTLRLIDAASIAAAADDIELDASSQATIRLADDPANNSATPTLEQMTSLFQTNSTAMLAKVFFAVERLRASAIAEVTGIAWE